MVLSYEDSVQSLQGFSQNAILNIREITSTDFQKWDRNKFK